MGYIDAIKTAILIFPIISLLFTFPFILYQYHTYGSIHKYRTIIIYSFIFYLLVIYFLVILPLPKINETKPFTSAMIRLVPFTFVKDFIEETSFCIFLPNTYIKSFTEPCFYIVLFNIFMMIPYGIYLHYYFRCSFQRTILFSFLLSLFFEVTQLTGLYFIYPCPYRVFDVDDLILNTLGGGLGYFLSYFIMRYLPKRDKINQESLEDGKIVSGFRRITIFLLDMILYFVFLNYIRCLGIRLDIIYLRWLIFIIYYGIIPIVLGNRTISSLFLKVKFDFPDHKKLRYLVRTGYLLVYYFIAPKLILFWLRESPFLTLALIFLITFYSRNIYLIIKTGKIYYDQLFRIHYTSCVHEIEKLEEGRN